jgi:hypothetical protein
MLIQIGHVAADHSYWELIPAGFGAVMGALVGAVPAFMLAKRSSKELLRRDADARRDAQKALAFRAMSRIVLMLNAAGTIWRQFEQSITDAEANGLNGPLWMKVLPMAGIDPTPVRFDPDEIALVFRAKHPDLANEMMLLAERHSTNQQAMLDYSARRQHMADQMGSTSMNGNVGTTFLTLDEHNRLTPLATELESLAIQLRAFLKRDVHACVKIAKDFSKAMQDHFNEPDMLKLSFDTELLGLTPESEPKTDPLSIG